MKKQRKPSLFIDETLCKGADGCGLCIHVCPRDVYVKSERLTERGIRPPDPVNIEACTGCMLCMMYCPDFAIVVEVETEESS